MSKEVDVLGRALHHAGVNVDRTTLGVALRYLESQGYTIAHRHSAGPVFHTQPAVGATSRVMRGEGGDGGDGKGAERSPEKGARRV